jgi:polysaccharide transporter, PST family
MVACQYAKGMTPPETTRAGGSLRRLAARGTVVNAAFNVALQSLALVRGFIVAAFLTTSEYGVWGILVVGLATLVWLKQVGVSDRYVQQDDDDQQLAFQRAFTMELVFTGLLGLVMCAMVPLLALLYGSELLAPGFTVMLALPAVVLQAPLWIFYRRMEFVRQRSLEAVEPVVTTLVAISLAVAGAGYWSLVIAVVAGAYASALVAVIACPYPIRLKFDFTTLRGYASFSWPLFVAGLSGIVVAQGSILAGDKLIGLAAVGSITLASTISLYAQRVDEIITATLYPAICAVKDRTELLFESFVKSNRLALMWGFPFGIALTLFASDLVEFGLGSKWEPAVGLLRVFGVLAAVNHIGFNWTAYFRARADTRPIAVAGVASMIVFVATVWPLTAAHGLDGFGAGMAITAAVNLTVRFFYLVRLFPALSIAGHAARAIAPTVPAVAAVLAVRALDGERSVGVALGELTLYAAVTVAATVVFERELLREVLGYLRRPRADAAVPVAR